jgi:catalase
MTRAFDTSREAFEHQAELYRRMTHQQRSSLALEMSEDVRQIAREGIQQRHPGYSAEDVRRALVALLYGADAAAKVWPGSPVPPP